jgi:eukaryotic-like serine/threonine-protein kinase
LSASTGNALWTFDAGAGVFSSPAVANGVVYVASINDKVHALDASTGAALWTATGSANNETSSPAVANGRVYIGFQDNRLYAFGLP